MREGGCVLLPAAHVAQNLTFLAKNLSPRATLAVGMTTELDMCASRRCVSVSSSSLVIIEMSTKVGTESTAEAAVSVDHMRSFSRGAPAVAAVDAVAAA